MAKDSTFKLYYRLTKPGIIYGNLFTATAGFLLASKWHINWGLLLATLLGISLIIASACVFNNYIDREIDAQMVRTKERALASGKIQASHALLFATILGIVGLSVVILRVNMLTALIGFIAFVDYVVLYGFAKRRSVHGTLVGSIAGAMPPVAGYTAVTNNFDTAALILFLIMVCWQMPHFYSIAMYRFKDYKRAGLPVLPVKKGMRHTKLQILAYIVAFTVFSTSLTFFGYTGYSYLSVLLVLGLLWFKKGSATFHNTEDSAWGRRMFLFSLTVMMVMSCAIAIGGTLP